MHRYMFLLFLCIGFVGSELLNKPEGAPCVWQERNGTCAHVYRCWSSMENIKKKNFPPNVCHLTSSGSQKCNILRLDQQTGYLKICGFKDKEPIVCCTDCRLVNDTRKIINDPEVGVLFKTGSIAEEKCYDFLQTLDYPCKKVSKQQIATAVNKKKNCNHFFVRTTDVNNTLLELSKKHYPHMAYLGYGENTEKVDYLCGGTIISERFILTAADCLIPDVSVGQVKYVAVGIQKRWVSPSEWQLYNVKRAIPHFDYKPPSKYHDIALVETDKPITFGPNVMPACLDSGSSRVPSNVTAMIWTDGDNGTLDFVPLSKFDELECSLFYPLQGTLANGYNHDTQMCAGDRKSPKDTCDGEIGSPLQSTFKSCIHVVRGVASVRRICGEAGGSGLYTRVNYYIPWIESIVWPSSP